MSTKNQKEKPMTNVLTPGPASNNLVVFTQSGRTGSYGILLEWPNTKRKVVYGFAEQKTFWADKVQWLPVHASEHKKVFTQFCEEGWWEGLFGGVSGSLPVTAAVFDARIVDEVCELKLGGIWTPLGRINLVYHSKATEPK
ncbi:MAG: hypothetical protein R3B53_00760 [Candidatus Paceibacterota bacterium]